MNGGAFSQKRRHSSHFQESMPHVCGTRTSLSSKFVCFSVVVMIQVFTVEKM